MELPTYRAEPERGGDRDAGGAAETADARARLLRAGLRLFAAKGYAQTSTRELAEAAHVNVAAISYYFGDKAGLYRAAFFEPLGCVAGEDPARSNGPVPSLDEAIRGFYANFLEPLKQGDVSRLCMKLRFREMLEPTGLWDEELAHGIQPMHDALTAALCRHFGLAAPDADLQRLAVAMAGLGVHMHVGRDVTDRVAPGLMDGAAAIDIWAERLAMFGHAMVQAEARRRGAVPAGRQPR